MATAKTDTIIVRKMEMSTNTKSDMDMMMHIKTKAEKMTDSGDDKGALGIKTTKANIQGLLNIQPAVDLSVQT